MESKMRIEELLERYFEARTSLQEEKELKEYFTKGAIDVQFEVYKPMFVHQTVAREEKYQGELPMNRSSHFKSWIAVAAVAGLGFGLFFGQDYREQQKAEYAYQETRKALSLLATNLDKGTEKVALLKEFENTTNKIYNN